MSEHYPRKETTGLLDQWSNIEVITMPRTMPATRDILIDLVEQPLQDAVAILYDRNIQTVSSSCNLGNYRQGYGSITLDGESLSTQNRQIVFDIPDHWRIVKRTGEIEVVGIFIHIGPFDNPGAVSQRASEMAQQFRPQPFNWAPRWTLNSIRQSQSLVYEGVDLTAMGDGELLQYLADRGYYLDQATDTIFRSEEHFQKYTQSLHL